MSTSGVVVSALLLQAEYRGSNLAATGFGAGMLRGKPRQLASQAVLSLGNVDSLASGRLLLVKELSLGSAKRCLQLFDI